ncbi:hypothetical protein G7Z17_g6841 [Cylindrodendrum hubeiense]|uniref:Peroxin 20 n=1 Tax=Cylindrodendrum hubeiense TaxID=595255 RepID=A0A9P5HBL0_9HYPO|nr:hypothetical protein G7Z17_g6841 [Cylindrodendrum hubeiense]
MADASCSGGTPFKRLTEHQSRDVSHHQDRLVDRAGSQAHGSFRSAPQAAQGQNGFNQFMDGPATLPGMAGMPGMAHHHAANRLANHAAALEPAYAQGFAPQANHAPVADVSNWAADFGRFSQQQQPLQKGMAQANPQMRMAQANAQMRMAQANPQMHMAQANPQMHMAQPNPQLAFQSSAFTQPNNGFSPLYGPTNGGFMDANAAEAQRPAAEAEFDKEMSRWMESHGSGAAAEMEDVDAVMDQMARELELNESALKDAEAAAEAEAHLDGTPVADLHTPDIAALSLETPAPELESAKAKSEVSEAAERLLESVQHEDGEKWKNSVFLSLMRDFRDGRKDIVDNEIRETPENDTEAGKAPQ